MVVAGEVRRGTWTGVQAGVVGVAAAVGLAARWWALGRAGLSFDETFTGAQAKLPLSELPAALRATDTHPPLDYLIRHAVAGTGSEWLLRLPSALFASLALLLVVAWMRRRSWFGVSVVVMFALDPFVLLHARQARMYSLLVLLGVVVAILGERWLDGDRRAVVLVGLGGAVALACLDHAGGLFMAAGALTLAGLGRRRDDWLLRGSVVLGVGVWAVVWGTSFRAQLDNGGPSWVPYTSPGSLAATLAGLVSFQDGADWVLVVLLVAGGVLLWRQEERLARLAVALLVVPCALLALVGTRYHVLLSRTLAPSAWAVPVLLSALVVAAWTRRAVLGGIVVALVVAVSARSVGTAVTFDEGSSAAVRQAVAQVEPGDTLVVHPPWFWPLPAWNGAEPVGDPRSSVSRFAGAEVWSWTRPGAAASGRTWVLDIDGNRLDTGGWESCGDAQALGAGWHLSCVVTGGR